MMPRNPAKKKDDEAHAEQKNVKKGKAMVAGGTVGTGQEQLSSDSGDPDLDIDRAMQLTAKPLRFNKSAPSSKHPVVIHKLQSRKTPHALTAAVAAAAASAEDTTGS